MEENRKRLWGVRLSEGVGRGNMLVYYYSAFAAICVLTLVNVLQPLVLTEVLGIPEGKQGDISGNLALVNELVIVLLVGLFGVLSDRFGRRGIYGAGFLIVAVSFALIPTATSTGALLGFRAIFAIGAAAVVAMLGTVIADYAVNDDRGKATGIMGALNGLGAALAALCLVKVPDWLTAGGMAADTAVWIAYGIGGGLAAITGVVLWRGLAGRRAEKHEERPGVGQATREGLAAARDPGVLLSYGAAFVARPDLAIVGLFLPLWANKYGLEQGMSSADAVAKGGMVLGICMMAALVWAPVIGIISDRVNRVGALALALGLNAVGFGATYFISNPFGGAMIAVAIIIGMGQVSGIIASQVLVAQQAPRRVRGSVIGVFGFCGALGIMVASKIGGMLFDSWTAAGPFVLLGALNGAVMVWALAVMKRVKPATDAEEELVVEPAIAATPTASEAA